MKRAFLLIVAIALIGPSLNAQSRTRSPINGLWLMTSGENAGQKMTEHKGVRLGLQNGKYVAMSPSSRDEGTYTVDETKTPHTITIKGTKGAIEGKTILGIYEVNKEGLTVCFDLSGKAFPDKFESKPNTDSFLGTYEKLNMRVKGPRAKSITQ